MRPNLARSCWFDTMTGKLPRKIGRERNRGSNIKNSAFG
jgi:hypothetical protein